MLKKNFKKSLLGGFDAILRHVIKLFEIWKVGQIKQAVLNLIRRRQLGEL